MSAKSCLCRSGLNPKSSSKIPSSISKACASAGVIIDLVVSSQRASFAGPWAEGKNAFVIASWNSGGLVNRR